MTEDELRQLLYRGESETLDFKRDQYVFAKGTDEQKAELLKDVMTFANAWRSTPAYILIGVDEAPQPTVVGIPEQSHLGDHDLQQFVNSKTNHPIRFGYQRVLFEGLHVGVLVIDHPQQRPIFLRKSYGHLRAGVVYLRRGSATAEALPDEVAEMGRAEAQSLVTPKIALEFAQSDEEHRLGANAALTCVRLAVRSPRDPADAEADRQKGIRRVVDQAAMFADTDSDLGNEWKEEAAKIIWLGGFRPIRFWVHNGSGVTASDVNLRLELPAAEGLEVIGETDHPKYGSMGLRAPYHTANVERIRDGWRVDVRLKKLQPKEQEYTGTFLIRAERPLEIDGTARISADNLAEPIEVSLHIALNVEDVSVSYYEAQELWDGMMGD